MVISLDGGVDGRRIKKETERGERGGADDKKRGWTEGLRDRPEDVPESHFGSWLLPN